MARYRGPRLKKCRAVGTVLPGLTTAGALDRPYGPGQHGQRRRRKPSDYKIRLVEKQKLRWHYGILEKQFKRYVREASRMRGPTGRNLGTLLESRLDNVVWRLGLAPTIPAARQLVVHRHITVDGRRVDRPSCRIRPGQQLGICEKSRSKPFIQAAVDQASTRQRPDYLDFDPAKILGVMTTEPQVEDIPFEVNPQAVVEFYSQQI